MYTFQNGLKNTLDINHDSFIHLYQELQSKQSSGRFQTIVLDMKHFLMWV